MLKFRPHHFLCTLGFQGKGYSPKFVENYTQIQKGLTPETLIEVVNETDSICAPCPHRQGKSCASQEKIRKLDQAHKTQLHLEIGDKITWGEALERLAFLSLETHQEICQGCEWQPLGLCAQALQQLTLFHFSTKET